MFRKLAFTFTLASLCAGFASCAAAATLSDQWYFGAGYASGLLLPLAEDNNVTRAEEVGQGATVFFGRDFDERSSGQFQLYSLGDVTFSDDSTATYTAADASVLYRFYDSRDTRQYARYGVSVYGRFGFGFVERESTIPLRTDGSSAVYFGAGAGLEAYVSNSLAIRSEVMFHERDAVSLGLTLVARFGGRKAQTYRSNTPRRPTLPSSTTQSDSTQSETEAQPTAAAVTKPQAVPITNPKNRTPAPQTSRSGGNTRTPDADLDDSSASMGPSNGDLPEVAIMAKPSELSDPSTTPTSSITALPTSPSPPLPTTLLPPQPNRKPKPVAAMVEVDTDNDGITDDLDRCPASRKDYPVHETGCSLFSFIGNQIKFVESSPLPLPPTELVLKQLAAKMKEFPATRIELIAHTDNSGDPQAGSALTRQRLRAIGIYLVQRGISKDRFLLRSFGNKRPAFTNRTAEGRQANNRIEINENP